MLSVKNISQHYDKESPIFKDLNFSLKKGEIAGIFGPNASGKTTLLHTIMGQITPQTGSISIRNNQHPAYIPQDYRKSFFSWLSLEMNILVSIPGFYKNIRGYRGEISALKKEISLDIDLSKKPSQCSGGMIQQAAILRAFISRKKLIIADEPFSALDLNAIEKLREFFRKKAKQGITMLLILHNPNDIALFCDKVLLIPNKPFCSKKIKNFHHAKWIKNANIKTEEKASISLEELIKKFLGKVS